MVKRFFNLVLLVVVFFTFGCEEDRELLYSSEVSLTYFESRGFNISFREVRTIKQDIVYNSSTYGVERDVKIIIGEVLAVGNNDVITIGNKKNIVYAVSGPHNQVLVNCKKMPINFNIQGTTVYGNNTVKHEYKGTCYFTSEYWQNGETQPFVDPYDKSHPGKWVNRTLAKFEFEIRDAMLILKAPAQYSMGFMDGKNASLPLSGSEVERIVTNGVEGVDYTLFTTDGMVYVRIKNNLYQRRYNSWVYAGIADAYITTTWIREQTLIIFDILDWNDIVKPYVCGYLYNGNYFYTYDETKNITAPNPKRFGDMENLDIITTPMPHCK